jgi:hypothetical protein
MNQETLFGLMAVAKEHQAAAEKAAKALDQAREAFDKERAGIPVAVAEAAKGLLSDQGKELQRIAAEARKGLSVATKAASNEIAAASRSISLWWLLAVFVVGVSLGGAGGVWLASSKQMDRIDAVTYSLWEQSPEGVKATAKPKE